MKQETAYGSRLANLAAAWFRRAEELDVYLHYEFTGAAAAPGREGVLETLDAIVARAIRLSGASPEREERWLTLAVDRQPERVRLICASSGVCPVALAALAEQGASTDLHQYPDAYDVTVDWPISGGPAEGAG